jgi:hypothetical protein
LGSSAKLTPQVFSESLAVQKSLVSGNDASGLRVILFEELQSIVPQPHLRERSEVIRPGLWDGVKQSIATSDISSKRVLDPHPVPEVNAMPVAWTTTIEVRSAFRKEGREHAVLHVKHRHVLVDRELEPVLRAPRRVNPSPAPHSGHS